MLKLVRTLLSHSILGFFPMNNNADSKLFGIKLNSVSGKPNLESCPLAVLTSKYTQK